MAIRIDLLPRYVGLRKWFKRILAACLALVGIFAVVLFALYYRDQLRLQTLKTNLENVRLIAQKTDDANAAAATAVGKAKPLQDTVNFFVDASRTGSQRAALLDLVRRYIYEGAVINTLDMSDGQTLKYSATVRTPDEFARLLNNFRRGTQPTGVLFSELPSGLGILGYPRRSAVTEKGKDGAAKDGTAQPAGATGDTGNQENIGETLRYIQFPNKIDGAGKLRQPLTIPVPPGDTPPAGAPGEPGAPDAPGAQPPA